MQIFKQGTVNELIIGIADDVTQTGVAGLLFTDVTAEVSKEGQTGNTAKVLVANDWHEHGSGWYRLKLSATDTDTLGTGLLVLTLGSSGSKAGYPFQVVANTEADVMSRLGAPAGASVSADIATNLHAALGLYVVIGAPTYNPSTPDLATVRVRLYDSAANANADDGVTGLVVEFTKTITYSATALSGSAHQLTKVVGA